MKLKTQTQTFNDGVVSIYSVSNVAEQGNKPNNKLSLKLGNLRFEERIVGMGRYWTALQVHAKIGRMIRTQRIEAVTVHDIAILNNQQYEIVQVQYSPDTEPRCMDLSLERLGVAYEIE